MKVYSGGGGGGGGGPAPLNMLATDPPLPAATPSALAVGPAGGLPGAEPLLLAVVAVFARAGASVAVAAAPVPLAAGSLVRLAPGPVPDPGAVVLVLPAVHKAMASG